MINKQKDFDADALDLNSVELRKIKEANPIAGLFKLLEVVSARLASGELFDRGKVFRHEDPSGWIVDTCVGLETEVWETGIWPTNRKHCTVVEQYESEEEAEKGHNRWVLSMQSNTSQKLIDIDVWGLGKLIGANENDN